MATKKTEKTDETTQVTEQSEERATPAAEAENSQTASSAERLEKPVVKGEALETLDELAQRHRVPAWQLGALLRYMGWESDKLVTETDFAAALRLLSGRPLGGGRL